jgi:hypothetical protein
LDISPLEKRWDKRIGRYPIMPPVDKIIGGNHQLELVPLEFGVPGDAPDMKASEILWNGIRRDLRHSSSSPRGMVPVIPTLADLSGDQVIQALMPHDLHLADLPLYLEINDGAANQQHHQHDAEIPKREFCR